MYRAQVAHKLRRRFRYIRALKTELLRIRYAVIRFVGSGKSGELIGVSEPVEFAGIHYAAAHSRVVTVHVLCCGVSYYVSAPFYRTAVYGRRERVIHDKRYAVRVSRRRKFFNVEHRKRGIGYRLTENGLCGRLKRRVKLLLRAVGVNKRKVDSHSAHGNVK